MSHGAPIAEISNAPPQLNPELDRAALARDFERHGRINIQRLLTRPAAQRIHACLTEETSYSLVFNKTDERCDLAAPSPQQRRDESREAWRRVGISGFQYLFEQHTLSVHGEPYPDPGHYWASVMDFLNGPEFLGLMRQISGVERIAFADAQATLYRAGHFLTAHDDNNPGPNRLLAYVLSFTPSWRPEWGGNLEFLDGGGQIEAGFVPGFNSLRLFRVPMKHFVSCVAPYAQTGRYAITGWLRGR